MQHDFILLDRSGSMSSMWTEALSAVNAYARKLADENVDTGITVATFDGNAGLSFDVIRDRITPKTFRPLSNSDASPRGMTPLNDAVGRLVSLATAGNYDKVAVIIMTDGEENSSRELSVADAKKLLDGCRAKGWQVLFLGLNWDNAKQSVSYGNAAQYSISSTQGNLAQTMTATAVNRSTFATGATPDMAYSVQQKVAAVRPNTGALPPDLQNPSGAAGNAS